MTEIRDDDDSLPMNMSKTPMIASGFNDWRYEKMFEVVEFCMTKDLNPPNFFQECLDNDLINGKDEAKLIPGEIAIVK